MNNVLINETSIIQFVDQLLNRALTKNASDIHIEPQEQVARIRFRIDGLLTEIEKLNKSTYHKICSRLKILAKLDIAEKRLPQDGRFSLQNDAHDIDCRLSTCPTLWGEKIVIRLLAQQQRQYNLNDIGLSKAQLNLFKTLLARPHGMILVTGPTGSGKTVTLYSALQYLNAVTHNITTVEDPVEIQLPGISQVNVNPKIGLDFATVLRAFLRQDPDIIMVGEIRDHETAEIAIKAAQTGHLVLSTLHTNSASEAITRLLHMNIQAYQLSHALTLIIGQRLVRKLCCYCHRDNSSCSHCTDGYKGRTGVFELLPISTQLQNIILNNSNSLAIEEHMQTEKILTLQQSGELLLSQKIIDNTEFQRVF